MAQKDTPWYELIGQQTDASVRLLVVCEHYCCASSLKEIEDLAVTCQIPMVKVDYQVAEDDNTVAVHENKCFPDTKKRAAYCLGLLLLLFRL